MHTHRPLYGGRVIGGVGALSCQVRSYPHGTPYPFLYFMHGLDFGSSLVLFWRTC